MPLEALAPTTSHPHARTTTTSLIHRPISQTPVVAPARLMGLPIVVAIHHPGIPPVLLALMVLAQRIIPRTTPVAIPQPTPQVIPRTSPATTLRAIPRVTLATIPQAKMGRAAIIRELTATAPTPITTLSIKPATTTPIPHRPKLHLRLAPKLLT